MVKFSSLISKFLIGNCLVLIALLPNFAITISQINNNNNYSIPLPPSGYSILCNQNENGHIDIIASLASNIIVAILSFITTFIGTLYFTWATIKKTMRPWKKSSKGKEFTKDNVLSIIQEGPDAFAKAIKCVPRAEFEQLSSDCKEQREIMIKTFKVFEKYIEQNIKLVNAYILKALKNIIETKKASDKLYDKIASINGMSKEQLANLPEVNEMNDKIFAANEALYSFYTDFDICLNMCLKNAGCQINSKLIQWPSSPDNAINTQIIFSQTEQERVETTSPLLHNPNENTSHTQIISLQNAKTSNSNLNINASVLLQKTRIDGMIGMLENLNKVEEKPATTANDN